MDTKKACKILEIDPGSSIDDVKKAFRKKAADLHPDKNKSPNAETEFKLANEAFQFLQKNGTKEPVFRANANRDVFDQFTINFGSIFNTHVYHTIHYPDAMHQEELYNVKITFAESVLGCAKEVEVSDKKHCCLNKSCPKCSGKGFVKNKVNMKLNVPAGVCTNTRFTIGQNIFNILVEPDPEMALRDRDVVSFVKLSLLECLKGTTKEVRTVRGKNTLKVPPRVRNMDSIRVSGHGVPPNGAHVFVVDQQYPENIDDVINVLDGYQPIKE